MRVLVIDNYDSFVYTIDGYLQELGATTEVLRNTAFSPADAEARLADYDAVLLSPGPGTPAEAGVSIPLVHAATATGTPLLGVCLGHQAIAEAFGATVDIARELMHGKTSEVEHDSSALFAGVRQHFVATRYHSLAVVEGTLPEQLVVTARTAEGIIMGLRHASAPLVGVQFHPESVMTQDGYRMLGNWLEGAGLTGAAARSRSLDPLVEAD